MARRTRTSELPGLPIPPAFLDRMDIALGGEFDSFLASYETPPVQGLRANSLKIAVADLAQRLPFDLQPVSWSRETFVVTGSLAKPGRHPYHGAGLYYLQDPSATAPVELLDPQPGETVLDLAAAPGGKSTHIAARLGHAGLLVANEVIHKRAWELAGNLERWGATNVAITTETPERLAERWPGFFDAVLVDAPCSGEGMFRKGDAARREWTPALVRGCALRQDAILEQAAALVRPGGRLVYSTCTFAPDEDEGTVARFLDAHPEFTLVDPPARPGFDPGRPDWLPLELQRPELVKCVHLWPHHVRGEGHFAALFLKAAGSDEHAKPLALQPLRLPKSTQDAYDAFLAQTFMQPPTTATLSLQGSYLYAVPRGLPDLTGLRYLHPGWWLGEVKSARFEHDRFEPSHALAIGVGAGFMPARSGRALGRGALVRRVADFSVDDPALLAYLRGETLNSAGEDGWTLVTVDGFPLGWAKQVANQLKSRYPKGLRVAVG